MVNPTKVTGRNQSKHDIMLYALSTCIWCRKTKNLLDTLDIPYNFIYVDKLSGQDKVEVMREVKKFNPSYSFPTLVIDNEDCIVGFREQQIKRAVL
jgi:glutaredoxin-like protein NrdH